MSGRCDNCGYVTTVTLYEENKWLCSVCSHTYLSRAISSKNRDISDGEAFTMRSIGYFANALIDALGVRHKFHDVIVKQDNDEGEEVE